MLSKQQLSMKTLSSLPSRAFIAWNTISFIYEIQIKSESSSWKSSCVHIYQQPASPMERLTQKRRVINGCMGASIRNFACETVNLSALREFRSLRTRLQYSKHSAYHSALHDTLTHVVPGASSHLI